MAYGYSVHLVKLVKQADEQLLGVRLGRACIDKGIAVAEVAERLGVSRQTVYNWFSGDTSPHPDSIAAVKLLLADLEQHRDRAGALL